MKRIVYSIISLLFLVSFMLPNQTSANSLREEQPLLNYVALGDSLAAGYLNDKTRGKGYPDFIKSEVENNTGYVVHLNNFGVGGYRTVDVIEQLKDVKVQQAIADADFITYDAGANDVLAVIGDVTKFDPTDEQLLIKIEETIKQVAKNIAFTLYQIKTINPDVDIYVMGYYNALYFLPNIQEMVEMLIHSLNNAIQSAVSMNKANYVSTLEAFEGKYEEYLPLPDIHPTEAGYVAIAEQFLAQITPNLDVLPVLWHTGIGAPSDELGYNTNKYLDIETLDIYEKKSNQWELVDNLKFYDGEELSGSGEPREEIGNIGDYYLDEDTNRIYIKVDASTWIFFDELNEEDEEAGSGNDEETGNEEDEGSENVEEDDNKDKDTQTETGEQEEDQTKDGDKQGEGAKLPNTSIASMNIFVIGLFMISVASLLYFVYRRRLVN
ncbi:GDSL-type esterase/lipase family protein [Bacillus kwashiorkori]|uniref:GDSL-type esterase/lipase family protein n=1 Tax=Bacillus kwashiorkori TaxID=1522318 RepID=UPI001EF11452|nr:GDSL-type esterase/lipase family protein [Bacillus kwashiorkori]